MVFLSGAYLTSGAVNRGWLASIRIAYMGSTNTACAHPIHGNTLVY